MTIVPTLNFSTDALGPAEAFAAWRDLMAPIIQVERSDGTGLPRGNLSCTMLGDILASRMVFTPQRMIRDRRHAEVTPDHLTFMLYVSGGLTGEIAGCPVTQQRNRVMAADMGRALDARGARSSAIGLTIPRRLLEDVDVARIPMFFDPERNRLLIARLHALYRHIPSTQVDQAKGVEGELIGFMRRLIDGSSASDVLQGSELDIGLAEMAERLIDLHLPSPDLSPEWLAGHLRTSRTSLYRAFEKTGGVMQRVWEKRLEAVRAALENPFETRSITRLAGETGFRTLAHLSRGFRNRYGVPPREWRHVNVGASARTFETSPARAHDWYEQLGRR